jgi:hypothetical protein
MPLEEKPDMSYIKLLVLIPFLTLYYQLYAFAVRQKGVERQNVCRSLGIASFTIGIVCLVFRDLLFGIAGIIFMMFGFRLIAHGLDRIDKKVFIDRFVEDVEEKQTDPQEVKESINPITPS